MPLFKKLMRKIIPLFTISLMAFPSCSVVMASSKSGINLESVQGVSSRTQLIALGVEIVISERNEKGELVETYKIEKERGSVARAFMHGLLDLGTCFFWELAGTPIESALDEKKFYSVKVTYDDRERIQKMELF